MLCFGPNHYNNKSTSFSIRANLFRTSCTKIFLQTVHNVNSYLFYFFFLLLPNYSIDFKSQNICLCVILYLP